MFVRRSKYRAMEMKYLARLSQMVDSYEKLQYRYNVLQIRWNTLLQECNSTNRNTRQSNTPTNVLTNDDIKRLLMLCHPDKHGGKEMAKQMTQRLLSIRNGKK